MRSSIALVVVFALAAPFARSQDNTPADTPDERWNLYWQATSIGQQHGSFPADYTGPLSLVNHPEHEASLTTTLFIGYRIEDDTIVYVDPEVAGGRGFSGVNGLANSPNGELPRVAGATPKPYLARAYIQHDFGFGKERESFESDDNQLAGTRPMVRYTIYAGRFSLTDFFDNNRYTHDPRSQFMGWAIMYNGAWDYPADTRGYTYGGVIELNQPGWALRYGAFAEPTFANGPHFDGHLPEALGQALELEERWSIRNRPGVVRLLSYLNSADMGLYQEATEHPGPNGPDVTTTRGYHLKYGFGVNAEQALTDDLGIFSRLGWNDGHTETWAYTEVDQTASIGLSLKGTRWKRPDDVIGLAGVVSGLSSEHREYLEAGGLGFELGDGRLSYSPEEVMEIYYDWRVVDHVFVTPDFQFVNNPGYNSDRGPVAIWGLRVHVEF